MAGGLRENFGTMTKPLHAGRAAQNGLTAALLARDGFTAALDILEAPPALESSASEAETDEGAAIEAGIAAADAQIVAARRGMDLVRREIEKARVTAPVGGIVLSELVEEGEFVRPGEPVAVIVDLSEVEVRIFVPEREIGRIALGAPARVRVDAFPERLFEGRVARIDQRAQEFVDDQELQVPAWSAQRWTLAERVTSGVTLAFAAAAIEIFAFGSRSALLLPR